MSNEQDSADKAPQTLTLWATSGYGSKSGKPFVTIHWRDVVVQVSPDDARRFARSIFEAAEAAEQDTFLFEWAKETTGANDVSASRILYEYREWREKKRSDADGM